MFLQNDHKATPGVKRLVDRLMTPAALSSFRGYASWMMLAATYAGSLVGTYEPDRTGDMGDAVKRWEASSRRNPVDDRVPPPPI